MSKTGPLARVWLAANLERKLSKSNILQSNIESSVSAIVDQGQAPMALRLSGQLLLGVVRIYSRKARYLLDDCTEAVSKIKLAFRPGNNDLLGDQSNTVDRGSLILPDTMTEYENPIIAWPDPNSITTLQFPNGGLGSQAATQLDLGDSQFLSGSIEQPRDEPDETLVLEEIDGLDLDLGDDLDTVHEDTSIEKARDAPLIRRASEEFGSSPKALDDDKIILDLGEGPDTSAFPDASEDVLLGDEMDIDIGGTGDLGARIEDDEGIVGAVIPQERQQRDTLSPLSTIRSSAERDLERTFMQDQNTTAFEPEEEESIHHAHKAKRRRILHADADTEIHSSQIRAQQNDRSRILKPASFLPRDPMLLALMTMQKNGGFVSSILGEGGNQGWAPELRGILSLEVVRRSGELKRKRDSGVADLDLEDEAETGARAEKTPQLEFEQAELDLGSAPLDIGADTTLGGDGEMIELADDSGAAAPLDEQGIEEEEAMSPIPDNFDDTTAPLLHPADSGPVSLGTKHAVHLLRERFGPAAAENESERQKTAVLFQDMLPETTTTRADATKMFFEILVLATKDAIKVDQPVDQLGGPIRIRGKRGLWGSWAETEAGGEMTSQNAGALSAVAAA